MNSKIKDRDQAVALNGWRSVLFKATKRWWGSGIIIGYSAIFIVPIVILFDLKGKWSSAVMVAAAIAIVLSIIGKLFMWRSDSFRGIADKLHRANELCTGLGHSIDPILIADVKSRYPGFMGKAQQEEENQIDYYEENGNPSPYLLVKQLRESAWWTTQLAITAKWCIYMGISVALFISLPIILFVDSTVVRAYGLAVCAIILVDILYLGSRFGKLGVDCMGAFQDLDKLKDRRDLTIEQAVISATNYQIVRGTGPLIPGWLWKWRRSQLQEAWKPLSIDRRQ